MAWCLLATQPDREDGPIRVRTFVLHDPAQEINALLLRTIKAPPELFLIAVFVCCIKLWRGAHRVRQVKRRADKGLSHCGMQSIPLEV
jgi:hypothetical protein